MSTESISIYSNRTVNIGVYTAHSMEQATPIDTFEVQILKNQPNNWLCVLKIFLIDAHYFCYDPVHTSCTCQWQITFFNNLVSSILCIITHVYTSFNNSIETTLALCSIVTTTVVVLLDTRSIAPPIPLTIFFYTAKYKTIPVY